MESTPHGMGRRGSQLASLLIILQSEGVLTFCKEEIFKSEALPPMKPSALQGRLSQKLIQLHFVALICTKDKSLEKERPTELCLARQKVLMD